jgi:predicted GNAT family acetyltransferase
MLKVTLSSLEQTRAFLESHAPTAMFLLSNLAELGAHLGSHMNSGNYKCIEQNGELCAVFCLTRRGNLLVEAGGRTDLAPLILKACSNEPIEIQGVIGEWRAADSIWQRLKESPGFAESFASKEILQSLQLRRGQRRPSGPGTVRLLDSEDYLQWEPVNAAYLAEEGLPRQGTPDQWRSDFEQAVRERRWWGGFEGALLVSTAALNARYARMGQVGGVYTVPERRRRGWSRAVMHELLGDSIRLHGLERLILFTGERNTAARALYRSLGFETIGEFALLFGAWRSAGASETPS